MQQPYATSAESSGPRTPWVGGGPLHIGLRYLLRKWLAVLAMLGVALSVGTLIVVMSVFTGFHLRMTDAIRGYLSDLTIRPATGGQYELTDWEGWAEQVRGVEHVAGVAPFVRGFALMRLRGTEGLSPVFFRGIHPELESQVSELAQYMRVGRLADLDKVHPDPQRPEAQGLRACFVGSQFPGFVPPFQVFDPDKLDVEPGQLVLVTATSSLETRLKAYAVSGLFETTYYDYDHQFVVMSLDTASDLAGSDGAVTGLNVRLDDYENAALVRTTLYERLSPGAELRVFGRGAGIIQAAVSADGSRVAGLTEAGEAILWEASSGREVERLPADRRRATALALSPDGLQLLLGCADGAAVVRDVASGVEALGASRAAAAVTAAAFSPDGFLIAVGYADGHVAVLDAEEAEQQASVDAAGGPIGVLAFDALSERLLAGGGDGAAVVLNAENGARLARLSAAGEAPIAAAAFSPDGRHVLTADSRGRAVLRLAGTGERLRDWLTGQEPVTAVVFGARPPDMLTAGPQDVRFWAPDEDSPAMSLFRIVGAGQAQARHTVFQADRKHAVRVDEAGLVRVVYCGPRFIVNTWEDEQRTFLEAVAMERFLQALIMSLILVVAEFFIFAIVTTVVNERRRDIGILKAVGYTRRQICAIFLLVGLAIGTAGGLLGVVGGLLFSHHINAIRHVVEKVTGFDPFPPTVYYFKEIPHHVEAGTVLLTAGGAIVCSVLFSLIPALRAARMDPVRTLHYE